MRRRRLPAVLATAALLAALAGGAAPLPTAAMEPLAGIPIPAEATGDTLPREVIQSMTFDIDGDGIRELVTVGAASDARGQVAIQVWWVDKDGHVTGSNEVRVRRAASPDELLAGRGIPDIDRDGMVAVRPVEPAMPFAARRNGRDVLFVAGEGSPDDGTTPCCLTIWEITPEPGGQIAATLVADTRRLGSDLTVADLDGDGTDELWVNEGPWNYDEGETPPLEVAYLRWDGSRFVRHGVDIGLSAAVCCSQPTAVGDTDRQPGDDLLITQYDPDGASPTLLRLTLRGDAVAKETAAVDDLGAMQILSLDPGPALVIADSVSQMTAWTWPRDEPMEAQGNREIGAWPAAIFGSGTGTRILAYSGSYPSASILVLPGDLGSAAGPRAEFRTDERAGGFLNEMFPNVFPWEGVIPDGLPGMPDVYLFPGQLVRPVDDPRRLGAAQEGPVMVGVRPVGSVGPNGAWEVMALNDSEGHWDPRVPPFLVSVFSVPAPGPIHLVSADVLLQGELNGGVLEPTFNGAAQDPERPNIERGGALVVGNEAVDAEIEGPPGTVVQWVIRGVPGEGKTIGPEGVVDFRVREPDGPDMPTGSNVIVRIAAVTPAGHAYSGSWSIRVLRGPPDLEVTVPGGLLNWEPVITGRTGPGVVVTVNGTPVEVAASGRFRLPVDPGILPTEFWVVARDPVDNVTTEVVSLLWPLDYRRLPFVPVAVAITVFAGALLYLRKPDTGPRRQTPDDDATFEEIGG